MMFITHFNRLIRNKILWGVFAVIIALSFVFWTTQTGGSGDDQAGNRVGKLNGKPVPPAEFQSAYFHAGLDMALMLGKPLRVNERMQPVLRRLAWRRLAALRAARDWGLGVSGDEVVAAIQQQPFFSSQGRFQPELYRAFVERFLPVVQATPQQFEQHIAQEILLSKLRQILSPAAWVAPSELEQWYHQLYDQLVISHVFLGRDDIAWRVQVDEDEVRSHFESHREDFTIPEQRRVRWVAFPFEPFLDEGALGAAELREHYAGQIERFSRRDTNDQWVATPFEAVEDDLRHELSWAAAVERAEDYALEFEVALAPDRRGLAPDFAAAAAAAGVAVHTTGLFSARMPIPGLAGAELEGARAAFELRRTPDEYFSRALKGRDAFYILALDEVRDARLPSYGEAREAVRAAAQRQAIAAKLEAAARGFYDYAAAAAARGEPLAKSLAKSGLEVETTGPFSIQAGLEDQEGEHWSELLRAVLPLNAGEMTALVPVADGYIFGRLDERRPAAAEQMAAARPELLRYLRGRRAEALFADWQDYLLVSAKFEDLALARRAPPDEPEEDAE